MSVKQVRENVDCTLVRDVFEALEEMTGRSFTTVDACCDDADV